ncbi:MAG TPA: FISUMP domain-containing protein [Bacteroidales bacterium]
MKKSTVIIIFLLLAILKTQAQDYLISFAGSGVTNVVGTVKVDNLTSGATVTLNGGDVLHLIPAVGIGTLDNNNETLHIYPNPMAEQAMLTFVASESGNAVIGIFDLSAKTVCQFSSMLSTGIHSFRISGISQGMYFVKVTGINYNYSTKLISQSNLQSTARIEYVSSVKNTPVSLPKNIASTIDMPYADGDQLLYKGITGIYSTIVTDVPASSKTTTFTFAACTDADNNNYSIVQIGGQTWMAENLNYSTGNSWCYDDSSSNCSTYGRLYDWQTALGACPSGWHLPSDAEWTALTDFLGGEPIAGGKMKETGTAHWLSPNTGATNSSGFTALPGGYRFGNGNFYDLTNYAYFWSSTEYSSTDAWPRYLDYHLEGVYRDYYYKTYGFSARCVHD